jgi:hypothetical protein
MPSLSFPQTTDRVIPSVSQDSQAPSATGVPSCRQCASDKSDITPEQRESAIDRAQRRARTHKDAYTAALEDYLKTQRPVFLHVAEIHKVRGEECERLANELIAGRQ